MSDLREAYKESGVNVEEGYRAVELIQKEVKSTYTDRVISSRAGFGGLFDLSGLAELDIKKPVLVSGTDGVGTKLKLAFDTGIYDTVGIDLVAMCVNDIICSGAMPLFFLDYIATGKLNADDVEKIVRGISDGCRQSKASLIGGETAEMPGFYKEGEFDLAGFAVGVVDKNKIIDGVGLAEDDAVIGLASTGPHSNGYSLIRKIVSDNQLDLKAPYGEKTLGETLLTPTKIYVREIMDLLKTTDIKAMAHITGGGFNENVARILPDHLNCEIDRASWEVPEIFKSLQDWGKVSEEGMYATFNMGIGFVLVVKQAELERTMKKLGDMNSKAFVIGRITKGEKKVIIK
ncbi:MAG: phosphoribosylformylglycinamidine cyclo-ligase [Bacillota bacterium]|nr:phosphoribosylformylglycinamidine cyclo-ligase [Bacillota bacterium]